MSLNDVNVGQPHAQAHNDERAAIRQLLALAPPRTRSGSWYLTNGGPTSAALLVGNGYARFGFMQLPYDTSFSQWGIEVTAAGDAGGTFKLGVWQDSGDGVPGALVSNPGSIATDAVGVITIGGNVSLPAGNYWVGGVVRNSPTTGPTFRTSAYPSNLGAQWTPTIALTPTGVPPANAATWAFQTGGNADLPNPPSVSALNAVSQMIRVFAKVA